MDLCLSNAIVKTGIGFSAGVVLSVLFLRRRSWPLWLGTGFGLGASYTDCERSFNPVSVPGVRILPAGTRDAPETSFGALQQRVGELLGASREKAADAIDQSSDMRATAHERFTELSQQGKEAIEKQVQQLQTKTQNLADKIVESGKDVANNAMPSTDDKKVRVV